MSAIQDNAFGLQHYVECTCKILESADCEKNLAILLLMGNKSSKTTREVFNNSDKDIRIYEFLEYAHVSRCSAKSACEITPGGSSFGETGLIGMKLRLIC
jgi:hypothetical protein